MSHPLTQPFPFPLPLLLDGATGTNLLAAGMPGGVCVETWLPDHPEVLRSLQRQYVRAGSRVLMAPTFGANRPALARHGVPADRVHELNRRLFALSKEAAGTDALVAGDLSPLGLFLPPMGNVSFEELVDCYTEQAAALPDADLFAVETTVTLAEARAAVLAVKARSDKPVFVTFTCDERGRTLAGTDVLAALLVMEGMGVDAFGLNCAAGPETMLPVLRRLGRYAHVPLIAKPNAGLPRMVDGAAVYDCPPEEFVRWVPQLAEAGVRIFGGCCGTTPAHIAALKDAVERADCSAPPAPEEHPLPAATERDVFFLDAPVEWDEPIPCAPDLAERLQDAEGCRPVAVAIGSPADLDRFAESQYAAASPLGITADDPALLEGALRRFQGRALWAGGSVPPEFLARMRAKYGLLLP